MRFGLWDETGSALYLSGRNIESRDQHSIFLINRVMYSEHHATQRGETGRLIKVSTTLSWVVFGKTIPIIGNPFKRQWV